MQQAQSDYRPHPKAPTAGELFWTIIRRLRIRLDLVNKNQTDAPPEVLPRIAGAQIQVIRNSGHLIPIDQPQQLADAIRAFVSALPRVGEG